VGSLGDLLTEGEKFSLMRFTSRQSLLKTYRRPWQRRQDPGGAETARAVGKHRPTASQRNEAVSSPALAPKGDDA